MSGRYAGITLAQGLELSYGTHLNWLATEGITGQRPSGQSLDAYLRASVAVIDAAGGACSYNHMFGASMGPPMGLAAMRAKITAVATALLANAAYGSHLLEVGYTIRGGADVAAHIEVWDILLAAGIRIYADGVSDNHTGTVASYLTTPNSWTTDILASSADPIVSMPALRAGRAFVARREAFTGLLDLTAGDAVMGGELTTTAPSVDLLLTAYGAEGWQARIVQYAVHGDRSRTARLAPLTDVTYAVAPEPMTISLPAAKSYVRVEIQRAGQCVAFTNPLFITPA